jgi:hypothetical protein
VVVLLNSAEIERFIAYGIAAFGVVCDGLAIIYAPPNVRSNPGTLTGTARSLWTRRATYPFRDVSNLRVGGGRNVDGPDEYYVQVDVPGTKGHQTATLPTVTRKAEAEKRKGRERGAKRKQGLGGLSRAQRVRFARVP